MREFESDRETRHRFSIWVEPCAKLYGQLTGCCCCAGGLSKKRKHYIEGGQAGNREEQISKLIGAMN